MVEEVQEMTRETKLGSVKDVVEVVGAKQLMMPSKQSTQRGRARRKGRKES